MIKNDIHSLYINIWTYILKGQSGEDAMCVGDLIHESLSSTDTRRTQEVCKKVKVKFLRKKTIRQKRSLI